MVNAEFTMLAEVFEKSDTEDIFMYGLSYRNLENGVVLCFNSLSSDRNAVEELIRLCSDGDVTEVTLEDIVYDFICK